jgi:protein-tyrosine phosphatase
LIDLHTHILPGIDDGPRDLAGSLTMAEVAQANGIRVLVATPHIREDHPRVRPAEIAALARAIDAELAAHGIDVRVVPGGELAITRAVDMTDDELRLVTLGGNGTDLLLETPHGALPSVFETVAMDLMARGFRVTLAHPELSRDIQRRPDILRRLVDAGALVQVTASSLEARWSRRGGLARRALKERLVHVVASDSHSATWRPPDLSAAAALGALGRWLTTDVPRALLDGAALPSAPR